MYTQYCQVDYGKNLLHFTNKMNVLQGNCCILRNDIALGTSNCQNDEQLLFMTYILLTLNLEILYLLK